MNKSKLKEGYYYESKNWYDSCPDVLPDMPECKEEIFPHVMSHKEILKKYKITPYASFSEAASVAVKAIPNLKNDYKGRIIYFTDAGVSCRLSVWRGVDGGLEVYLRMVGPDLAWSAGDGVLFSNGNLETLDLKLSPSDSLTLARAIEICKENGLIVYEVK